MLFEIWLGFVVILVTSHTYFHAMPCPDWQCYSFTIQPITACFVFCLFLVTFYHWGNFVLAGQRISTWTTITWSLALNEVHFMPGKDSPLLVPVEDIAVTPSSALPYTRSSTDLGLIAHHHPPRQQQPAPDWTPGVLRMQQRVSCSTISHVTTSTGSLYSLTSYSRHWFWPSMLSVEQQ